MSLSIAGALRRCCQLLKGHWNNRYYSTTKTMNIHHLMNNNMHIHRILIVKCALKIWLRVATVEQSFQYSGFKRPSPLINTRWIVKVGPL